MNWQKIIIDLCDSGLTQQEIAAKAGCAQTTVSELASGKTADPRFSLGQRLLAIARKRKPTQTAQEA